MRRRRSFLFLAALGAGAIVSAQPTPPSSSTRPRTAASAAGSQAVGVTASRVAVDLVVRDRKGRLVRDLEAGEVELLEDGAAQEILSLRLVDTVGGARVTGGARAAAPAAAATAPAADEHPLFFAFLFDRLSPQARRTAHQAAVDWLLRPAPGRRVGALVFDRLSPAARRNAHDAALEWLKLPAVSGRQVGVSGERSPWRPPFTGSYPDIPAAALALAAGQYPVGPVPRSSAAAPHGLPSCTARSERRAPLLSAFSTAGQCFDDADVDALQCASSRIDHGSERRTMTHPRRNGPGAARETLDLDAGAANDLRRSLRARAAVGATANWVLESRFDDGDVQRTQVQPVPFTIGRTPGLPLVLPSVHVSKLHAQIYSDGLALRVRDLGSRNGTFLNHHPITDAPLHEGDVLGIGNYEFHVEPGDKELAQAAETIPLTRHIAATRVRELIDKAAVAVTFQPIVAFGSGETVAYEALGTGALPGLPQNPVELFDLAGALGPEAQAELSRLFRYKAVELLRARPDPPLVFLNTHPADLEQPGLLPSLEALRVESPGVKLVLEVHESALANPEFIAALHGRLGALGIGLAYDDFGAGQARLLELAEAPPDYLKFDRRFVTGIESAPVSRRRLVASLVAAARELLVSTVAEGVETAEEAAECRRAGFSHAQGYYFGRPAPLA